MTSGFAMRMHPILNTWKQHNGVDYGAPSGTPVRTIGDGIVEFAGWQNGYGNVVHVKHNGDLHDGLRAPEPDRRRQGRQGRAGPDASAPSARPAGPPGRICISKCKIDGAQQDPLLVAQSSEGVVLTPAARAQLAQLSQSVRAQLGVAQTLAHAQVLGE